MQAFLAESAFFAPLITLGFFALGQWLRKRFRLAVFNPILISVLCVIVLLSLLKLDYESYSRNARPISFFLTPATVCLAVPMYEQLSLLKAHWRAALLGVLAGVAASLACALLLGRAFSLSDAMVASLLPKSVTSAIGGPVAEALGGVSAIAIAAIILSGIFGNITAEAVFRLFRISDPVARGLAIGASSHAIGTGKALELGQAEGAMSSLAIVLAGLMTAVLAPVCMGLW